MTREEYVAKPRDWFGFLSYPGKTGTLRVALIARYSRGCPRLAGYPRMSASSGPKDYIGNDIYFALERSGADELLILRASGPTFALLRKGTQYFDVDGDPVEVTS